MELHLTFPGNIIVKKNTAKTSMFRKDATGKAVLRTSADGKRIAPVHYCTKEYKEWARNAIQKCMAYRTQHRDITYPLTGQYNLKCLFYYDTLRKIDLPAMFEGVFDVLAGSESWINVNPNLWQILIDDSARYIGSLDGSRFIYDVANPRTELWLTPYIL